MAESRAEELASQRINATNPATLEWQNALGKGADYEDPEPDASAFMQLMYEQGSELDVVDRIHKEMQNGRNASAAGTTVATKGALGDKVHE